MKILVSSFVFILYAIAACAQSDRQLFNDYVKIYHGWADPFYYTSRSVQKEHGTPDSIHVSIKNLKDIDQLVAAGLQRRICSISLQGSDSLAYFQCLERLSKFPSLKCLKTDRMLPATVQNLRQIRVIEFTNIAGNLQQALAVLEPMPELRGLVISDCKSPLPASVSKLKQLSFVAMAFTNVKGLNLADMNWKILSISGNYDTVFDKELAGRLADMSTLRELHLRNFVLNYQNCLATLQQINSIDLNGLKFGPGIQLLEELNTLSALRHLSLTNISDTAQRLDGLKKLIRLESLQLNGIAGLKSHPEALLPLAQYHNLKSLVLSGNELAEIPEVFTQLRQLQKLTIFGNNLRSGKLPEGIFKLPNLTDLNLEYNALAVLSPALLQMARLETLKASFNRISGIPGAGWEHLGKLKVLALDNNQLTTFPDGVQNLKELRILNLRQNQIRKFPHPRNGAYQLRRLDLRNNQIEGLPDQISNYTLLEELEAGNNRISHLPRGISALSTLKILNLENNRISEFPRSGFNRLRILELANNTHLDQDDIFDFIFSVYRPDIELDLSGTGITALPASPIWAKIGFKTLNLSHNKLTTLPEELTLSRLGRVNLDHNPLPVDSGTLKGGFYNLASMKIFYNELGIPTPNIKIEKSEYAKALTKRISVLSRPGSYGKAVAYAEKAIAMDKAIYEQNIWWPTIAMARLEVKDYAGSIRDVDTYLVRGPFGYIDGGSNMSIAEYCKSQAYLALDQKERAAETYAYFGHRAGKPYSYLNAAFLYLELKKDSLYNKYMDSTLLAFRKEHTSVVSYGSPWSLFEYAEVLIMANQPSEALELFAAQSPTLFENDKPLKSYLEAVATLLQDPASFERIKKELSADIGKNGKIKDWYYRRFNTWIEAVDKPAKLKQQFYALQAIGK